jgi:hypothetical protein
VNTEPNHDAARARLRKYLRTLLILFAAVNIVVAAGGALVALLYRFSASTAVEPTWLCGFVLMIYGATNIGILLAILMQLRKKPKE